MQNNNSNSCVVLHFNNDENFETLEGETFTIKSFSTNVELKQRQNYKAYVSFELETIAFL